MVTPIPTLEKGVGEHLASPDLNMQARGWAAKYWLDRIRANPSATR